jgi:hypothetical protein
MVCVLGVVTVWYPLVSSSSGLSSVHHACGHSVCCFVSSSSRRTCACCVGSIEQSDGNGTSYFELPGKLAGRTCAPLVIPTWMPRIAGTFEI